MKDCPCGAGFPYTDCCGPLIRGVVQADTAEDLMRSRFTALARGEWEYIERTRYRGGGEPEKPRSSYPDQEGIVWTKLEIYETRDGGAFDAEGEVSFAAWYTENGEEKILRETSKFIREDGRWFYSEPQSKSAPAIQPSSGKPFVRDQPKVGRNDPCPGGSKKKYKKCCG